MLENITKKLASVYLNVSPPVVFIENDLDGLHKEGSWTILRDGTRQVRNVFDAMESILKSNKDYLGQSVITHFFQDQQAFNVLKKGFAVKLDDEDLLTKEEKLLYNTIKMQKKEKESEVESAITEYTLTREELVPEAMTLAIALHENGFHDRYQLSELNTVEVANKLAPFSLNATTEILLKEIFNVDRVFLPTQDKGIGQSYKLKEDCLSQQQVYMLTEMRSSVATNDRLIPEGLKYTRCEELKYGCQIFETERRYLFERQNCLNISAPISNSPQNFGFESLKPGHNVINSDGNIIRRFSFVLSKRLYQLQIDPTGAWVNSDFLAHLGKLQTSFDKDDASHKRDFCKFFEKWHHYIVTQVDCGGSLEISIDAESLSNIQDISLIPACIEKELNLLTSKTTATTSNRHLHSKSKPNADLALSRATVNMKGGETHLHVTSLEELTPEKYEKWLRSLEESFEILENGIKLQPMYLAMADMLSNGARLCIDEKTISSEKVDAVYEAQCYFLGESFRQANTRDESTSGIFNYLGNMLEGNAMSIALAGGALLLRFLLKR